LTSDELAQARLREAFAARAPREGACDADPQRIWSAAAGEATAEESRALLLHAAQCASCDLLWRLAAELRGAAGLAAGAGEVPARRWKGAIAVAFAAAAAIALVPVFLRKAPPAEPPFREEAASGILALSGEGALARDRFLLRWTPLPPGTRYSLAVARRDLAPLYLATGLEVPEHQVPASAFAGVPSGTDLFWRIEARLPDGRRLSSRAFSVRVE
jgi:hypothetical protein